MKISLRLGGSLLTVKTTEPYVKLSPDKYRTYAETLKELHDQGHEIMVVCGGGKPARHFIDVSKQLGGSRDVQDLLGVKASHVNALLMMSALGDHADQTRIYQRGSDLRYAQKGKILVFCCFGITDNMVKSNAKIYIPFIVYCIFIFQKDCSACAI